MLKTANRGQLDIELPIPTIGREGGADCLLGVFGANHLQSDFDFKSELRYYRSLLPHLVLFGFDQGNGKVFIDMRKQPGRLVYVPWDELQDEPMPIYHVATSQPLLRPLWAGFDAYIRWTASCRKRGTIHGCWDGELAKRLAAYAGLRGIHAKIVTEPSELDTCLGYFQIMITCL